ncbi:putative undecaprenyl diphosphate synthase domain-containing protein [Hirsutella rhossiliensis]|uniref:ditrans,polycis-polyprenyl diphosphate synthase [(2E,6E)-farnesyldiphosphate specific] n=1 Tax=Hirsutella rhossiliensis TaxID=111463 RepID=A0A9P8SDH9_9HYPO|nr:putative undecaprenyl diphosphate synthase domain-containing protein [Hirsutella rhossiliensis]KAH0957365.1 putative undecaprenyl diphosphate synthase domain-containing protein [Hirsutella rhossiliensis]
MPVSARARAAYRADELQNHALLNEQEKKRLLRATLPAPSEIPSVSTSSSASHQRPRLGVRRFLRNQLHVVVFAILHGIFSLYIRTRQTFNIVCYRVSSVLYYHHATPQYIRRDVTGLERKPKHLSAILKAQEDHRAKANLERLIDETAELATWCACAEIPMLSIYEKTGILKKHMPRVYDAVIQKFTFYFAGEHPSLSVTSPHRDEYSSPTYEQSSHGHLKLHLISAQDGRESIVDLTRTLAEMSQKGKLSPRDISIELVDTELSEGIMPEPDLLILFSPYPELASYPPWQIRLTEIFCLKDNESFGYQVFLKALRKYSRAQMRHGK